MHIYGSALTLNISPFMRITLKNQFTVYSQKTHCKFAVIII